MSTMSIHTYSGYPTETAMRVYVTLTVTYAASYKIRFKLIDENGNVVVDTFGTTFAMEAGESITKADDFYKTFTGLTPGSDYGIIATLWNATANYELAVEDTLAFTTDGDAPVPSRPSDWRWPTSGISRGSGMNYTQSGSSVIPKPLTATEWLSFIERIKEFYTYLGLTISSTYLSRATTGVSKGSKMTAIQANGARYLIDHLDPPTPVPDQVSSGDRITAAFINGLKNSLNSID